MSPKETKMRAIRQIPALAPILPLAPILALGLACLLAFPAAAQAAKASCAWRPAWASAQMVPDGTNGLPERGYADATLRQIVRATIAGRAVRVRLSNAFGTAPLVITAASIAPSADNSRPVVAAAALRPLAFGGRRAVTIPAGAEMLSDPVAMPVAAFADLAVSIHYAGEPAVQTGHPGARANSWFAPGDQTGAADLGNAVTATQWFQLSGVEVDSCPAAPVIVALGDSITDGRGTTTNGNDRWTDILARRLAGRAAVLNAGIGGNRLLLDGLGPNALARLDRDVLAQPGVTHLIILEGINDLGTLTREAPASPAEHEALVARMTLAYAQIVERAHARGITVIGGTLLPFMGFDYYHPDAANEADRQAINAWIRTAGHFDGVVDFDAALRDPARPDRLAPAFDSGDHIHPGPAGYKAMGEAVSLDMFTP
jgi:lysophospholipase L1-like esterase